MAFQFETFSSFSVIRHTDIQPSVRQQDKFRLHIFEHGLQEVIGKKEIMAILEPSRTQQQVPVLICRLISRIIKKYD